MKYRVIRQMLWVGCLLWSLAATAQREVPVSRWGVKGDGVTLNTRQLQQAIDELTGRGGGTLCFPAGCYLTGSLQLRSGVELHLEQGATLLGSSNPADYTALQQSQDLERNDNSQLALLVADGAEQIAISGRGTIDGNGRALALAVDSLHHAGVRIDPHYNYKRMRPNETARPKLFFFVNCRDIRVQGVSLRSSAAWGLSFDRCRQLVLEDLSVVNRAYWNNDGVDVTDCRNVIIRRCTIDSADDGICLKSYHADACNDCIFISDCTISSSASAVKFGTASRGGFRNVEISRIRVKDTFRSAIAIESVDGACIEHVRVSDVVATQTGNALFIRLGHRSGERPGQIRDVRISRLWCEVPFGRPDLQYDLRGPEVNFFHNPFPSSITGIPGACVEDVTLEDIEMVCPGRSSKGMAYVPLHRLQEVPEKIQDYPEFSMFGELPCWALYVRHVRGLQLKRVRLMLREEDFRPAMVLDDVQGDEWEEVESNWATPWIVRR